MNYDRLWENLNFQLQRIEQSSGELSQALISLETHQHHVGFLNDDLKTIKRLIFAHPNSPDLSFRAQLNKRRSERHGGAGIKHPSDTLNALNDGCFLCRENIRWQQNNRQIGFEVNTNNREYYVWMNPFPLLPNHLVVADRRHSSQEIGLFRPGRRTNELVSLLEDLCEIASRLPEHIGFFNGVGAGASIPSHLHFQFVRRPAAVPVFPLEQRSFLPLNKGHHPALIADYPLSIARWRGPQAEVISNADKWLTEWFTNHVLPKNLLTCNLIASFSRSTGETTLFFIPRRRDRQFWNGRNGIVGGLEILGELVLASSEECLLVEKNMIDFFFIERALSAVNTPIEFLI